MTAVPSIDLLDLSGFRDHGQPWEQYRWLRQHDAVHWHPETHGRGFWAVMRHRDVQTVSRDSDTFSSWRGGVHIPDANPAGLAGVRNMMLYMDPPQQVRYRLLVRDGFTPRAVASLQPRVHQLARQIVDEVIERGECDFVTQVSGELPSYVIAELLGVPLDDGRMLYELTEKMHSTDDAAVPARERAAASAQMLDYARAIATKKRAAPQDDIATVLVNAEVDGDRFSEDEFAWFFLLLVNAGGDTTRNLVAAGMETLFMYPSERRRLQENLDELLPSAVEEMLRFCSPVVHFRRTATRDIELGGKLIKENDKLVMFYGSANRDEAVFREPDTFDVSRAPNDHVAFGGGGAHYCLGVHLARSEARAMLHEVLTRMPDIEQVGAVERLPSNFIAGPQHLPVRFTPGRRVGV